MIHFLKTPMRAVILGTLSAIATGSTGMATTVKVITETGTAMETESGIRADTGTRGYELAGATVTASFTEGADETAVWFADPFALAANGGVNGDQWSLFQNGFGVVSLVSNGRIMTGFEINASTSVSVTPDFSDPPNAPFVQGASLFDVSAADEALGSPDSTPGSSFGFPFRFLFNAPDGDVTVTYSGAVNIKGFEAVGDLFTTMSVDFTGLVGGGFTGSSTYESDQDTLRFAGDLTPVNPSPIPLPAGLPLLLAGLGGLALLRRNRR